MEISHDSKTSGSPTLGAGEEGMRNFRKWDGRNISDAQLSSLALNYGKTEAQWLQITNTSHTKANLSRDSKGHLVKR